MTTIKMIVGFLLLPLFLGVALVVDSQASP